MGAETKEDKEDNVVSAGNNSLIKWSAVKKYALEAAVRLRPARRWTRVSKQLQPQIEAVVRMWLDNHIRSMPSRGKAIK